MELKYIQAFLKIVETGSFSAAGEALYISQPTISIRIQQLEKELNQSLFIRVDGKKIKLTRFGEKAYPLFREAMDLMEQVAAEAKKESGGNRDVTISCPNHMGVDIMPEVLNVLFTKYPEVEFQLKIDKIKNTIDGVRNRKVDIGFVYVSRNKVDDYKGISMVHITDEKNILVCSPEHPLAKQEEVSVTSLKNERIIIYDRDYTSTRTIERFLQSNGLRDYRKAEIDNLSWIQQMVRKGLGIAFLQHIQAKKELESGELVEIPLREPLPTTSVYLMFHPELDQGIRETTIQTARAIFHKNA